MEGEIWKAHRNRLGHTGKAMRAMLEFVERKSPVRPRDVGARFGVSLPAARHRLRVALEAGLIAGRNAAGDVLAVDERWTVERLLSGEFDLVLADNGARFLKGA